MAESFFIDVAISLGSSLASYAKGQLLLAWELNSEVEKLKSTVVTINAYLKDVEGRPGGITSHSDRDWLTRLRKAVYDADDVFDEIVTIAERKRLREGNTFGNEVKLFCSSSNQLITSISLAQRIKSIRELLDESYETRRIFGDPVNPHREATVRGEIGNLSDNVVGRDKEKTDLIGILLDSSYGETVCVIPIVGVGGLGKSTLARHVFNDRQVKANFNLHLWVSLPEDVTLLDVMAKIVAATGESGDGSLDQLKIRLSRVTNGKKYILVLDNVWKEDVIQWRELEQVLTLGAAPGSRIMLTTRLPSIAEMMGTVEPFELPPLECDKSWALLESLIFGSKGCQDSNLKEIGMQILPMCYNVPLAIRALAGVLANDIRASCWLRFKNDSLSNLASHDRSYQIMPILRLSYDYLSPSMLKSCFSYCSLFPKGYEFDKYKLVILWIAQGFIEPLHQAETLENEGAEYLEKLLNKGLLQHVPSDESHSKCKLHDLMHDLCCSVAAEQCQMLNSRENDNVKNNIYHISIGYEVNLYTPLNIPSSNLQSIGNLRTFLLATSPRFGSHMSASLCKSLMTSLLCLRVLGLNSIGIRKLPKSLGRLIHLRYLDLSHNGFKRLPNSVSELHNLQYLDLSGCWFLIEMPKGMNHLVNLRHLLLRKLSSMSHFPLGIGNLTNLQTLDTFIVGTKEDRKIHCIAANKSLKHGRLGDLKRLNNLQGELSIYIKGSYKNMGLDALEASLKVKTNLRSLSLNWEGNHNYEDESVLENLQPHDKILELEISGYRGEKLPTWMATKQLTSSLVHLEVVRFKCANIKRVPSFSQLPNLKGLLLRNLPGVEYLGCDADECAGSEAPLSPPRMFFPSLTEISIDRLPNLKGWREVGLVDVFFPCVAKVAITRCQELEFFPSCPNVEDLEIRGAGNVKLLKEHGISSSLSSPVPKLKSLEVDSVGYLASLPRKCLVEVSRLSIKPMGRQLVDVRELEKGLEGMFSVKCLQFQDCKGLISFSGLPVQLSTLERFEISSSSDIPFLSDGDESEEAWQVLKSLRSLHFIDIDDMKVLPRGIRHLTTLQSLHLELCTALEALPDWIGELCSLSRLEIMCCLKLTSLPQEMIGLTELKLLCVEDCPELGRRCQRGTGEDWHKIQHIKEVIARYSFCTFSQ